MKQYDYIIIGAGLSGLTCGIILAKEGKKVLIVEKNHKPGGYLQSFYRKGHRFETGFHFIPKLIESQILSQYWKYLGIMDRLRVIPYPVKHCQTIIFPDRTLKLPSGREAVEDCLRSHFPKEEGGIRSFFKKIAETTEYFSYYNPDHRGEYLKEFSSLQISLGDFFRQLKISRELEAVLSLPAFFYGVPPDETSLGLHSIFADAFFSPLADIEGGGDALVNALTESLGEHGGELLLNETAVKIRTGCNQVAGVLTDNEQYYRCENIIFSPNPKICIPLFDEYTFSPKFTKRITGAEDTVSHFGLYILTPNDLNRYTHNIYSIPGYDFTRSFHNPVSHFPDDFAIYLTVPTSRNNEKDGKHVVEAVCFDRWETYSNWQTTQAGKRPPEYRKLKAGIQEKVLEKIMDLIPELKEIDAVEASTPLTNHSYTGSPEGSIFGIMHTREQLGSPIPAKTRVGGFYFTGQSLITPGILGVTITGFITCASILGTKYLFEKISEHPSDIRRGDEGMVKTF